MRIPAIVTVLALACGSAMAAQSTTGTDRNVSADRDRTAVVSNDTQAKPAHGIVQKTKRGMHRMGDKTRATGDRISHKISKTNVRRGEQGRDTRAMGSTRSTTGMDRGDRQARMDDAYDSWKSKQR